MKLTNGGNGQPRIFNNEGQFLGGRGNNVLYEPDLEFEGSYDNFKLVH